MTKSDLHTLAATRLAMARTLDVAHNTINAVAVYNAGAETLYHYTGTEGMRGIGASGSLWATYPMHTNDSLELSHGIKIFRDLVAETNTDSEESRGILLRASEYLKAEDEVTFVVSFSAHKDSLSQWRAYAADGAGYAIGFKQGSLLECLPRSGNVTSDWVTPLLVRVEYGEERQKAILLPAVTAILFWLGREKGLSEDQKMAHCMGFIWALIPTFLSFKNAGFREEGELRLLVRWIGQGTPPVPVRATRFGLSPYVELALPNSPFAEVWLGPRIEATAGELGVNALFKPSPIGAPVAVIPSAASYRGVPHA